MKNKKIFSLLLIIALFSILLLTGCGEEQEETKYYSVYLVFDEETTIKTVLENSLVDYEPLNTTDYLFLGWYDEDFTTCYDNTPVTSDLILYAKLIKFGTGYNITYDLDEGEFETKQVRRYCVGEETTLPTAKKEPNFEFVGWTDGTSTFKAISPTTYGDLNLKAVYIDHNTYCKVTYKLDGGKLVGEGITSYRVGDSNYINQTYAKKEGYYFKGWYLEDTYQTRITTIGPEQNTDITLYAKFEEKTKENTTISYFGDSITTYEGEIPTDFLSYYPIGGCDVTSKEKTWWYQLTTLLGYQLLMNNSYSGSFVSKGTAFPNDTWYGSNPERVKYCAKDGENPDIIIIHMGTNDFSNGVSVTTFKAAYKEMLDLIYYYFDDVEVYVCLHPYNKYGEKFVQIRLDYNEAIKEIAAEYGITYFDLSEVITIDNYQTMMCYNPHPSALGMTTMANYIYQKMTSK